MISELFGLKQISKKGSLNGPTLLKRALLSYSETSRIPSKWKGIFYLKDSKAADDFACMESSEYSPETGLLTLHPPRHNAFFFRGFKGRFLLWCARFLDLTYLFNTWEGYITVRVLGIKVPRWLICATFREVSNKNGIVTYDRKNYFANSINLFEYTLIQYRDSNSPELDERLQEFSDKYDYYTSTDSFVLTDIIHKLLSFDSYISLFKRIQLFVLTRFHRGGWWKLLSLVVNFNAIIDLVLLIAIGKGDRKVFFRRMSEVSGGAFPYGRGVMFVDHKSVSGALNASPTLKRAEIIGTSPVVTPECFSSSALIFLDGSKHLEQRAIFEDIFKKAFLNGLEPPKNVKDSILENLFNSRLEYSDVVEYVARYVFSSLLKVELTQEDVKEIQEYEKLKLLVFMPKFLHLLMFKKYLKRIQKIRMRVADVVKRSPLLEEYKGEVVFSLVDLLLFAACVGTTHLVSSSLNTLKQHPQYLLKFEENQENIKRFITECARLDPPVTSVNTLSSGETIMIMGSEVTIPDGFPLGWCISESNSCPKVFENPSDFLIDRYETQGDFDKTMTFNGIGLRKCIGKQLSLSVATSFIKEYAARFPECHPKPVNKITLWEKVIYRVYNRGMKRLFLMQKKRFDNFDKFSFKKDCIIKPYEDFENFDCGFDKPFKCIKSVIDLYAPISGWKFDFVGNLEFWLRKQIISRHRDVDSEKRTKFENVDEFNKYTQRYEKELNFDTKCPLGNRRTPSALYDFFVEHMGLVMLEPTNNENIYVASSEDFFNEDIKIQQGYQGVSFRVVLNTENKEIVSVRYNGVDYKVDESNEFRYACDGVLTSALTYIILVPHYFGLHVQIAQALSIASHYSLSEDSPLFRLVHPFTFNCLSQVGAALYALFSKNIEDGILANILPPAAESYPEIQKRAFKNYKGNDFGKSVCEITNSDLSSDCKKFYDTFEKYVSEYIDIVGVDDESKRFYQIVTEMVPNVPSAEFSENFEWKTHVKHCITNFLFCSSVVHELIGQTVLPFFRDSFRVSSSLLENGNNRVDNQCHSSNAVLSNAATYAVGIHSISLKNREVLRDMFDNIATDKENVKNLKDLQDKIWKEFQENDEKISELNKLREVPQDLIRFDNLEYSVAT